MGALLKCEYCTVQPPKCLGRRPAFKLCRRDAQGGAAKVDEINAFVSWIDRRCESFPAVDCSPPDGALI